MFVGPGPLSFPLQRCGMFGVPRPPSLYYAMSTLRALPPFSRRYRTTSATAQAAEIATPHSRSPKLGLKGKIPLGRANVAFGYPQQDVSQRIRLRHCLYLVYARNGLPLEFPRLGGP